MRSASGRSRYARAAIVAGALAVLLSAIPAIAFAGSPVAADDGVLPSEIQRCLPADGKASQLFGASIAISGDTMVVGSSADKVGANAMQGSAYVFIRNGTSWTQQAKLVAPDGATMDAFGYDVGISGDTAVVSAYADDIGSNGDQGSAYVFVRDGTSWSFQRKLTAVGGGQTDLFGASVAILGSTIVVGSPRTHVGANDDQGAAFVFTRVGTSWTQRASLHAADGSVNDGFGSSVSISRSTILVGADADDVGANSNQGSAYVFVRSGLLWKQEDKLVASDGAKNDWFGGAVSLDDDTALIGAPGDDIGMLTDQGSAYIFTRTGTSWTQQDKLTATSGRSGDGAGNAVALSGNMAVLGVPADDDGPAVNQGSITVFTGSRATWDRKAWATGATSAAADGFGGALALDGGTLVVGAFGVNVGLYTDVGAAYVFSPYETQQDTAFTLSAPGVLANDRDADGDHLTAVKVTNPAHGTVTQNANGSLVYTPNAGFSGLDSFTYKAYDGTSYSAVANVTLKVNAVNAAPVAVADAYAATGDTTLTVDAPGVLSNDTDAEGTALKAIKVTDPAHGAVTLEADGSFDYVPTPGYSGADTFTYNASDGVADSAPVAVAITVSAVNVAPVAVADAYSTAQDATLTVAAPGLLANDTDAEASPLSAEKVSDPAHGSATLAANGSFVYVPTPGYSGTDSFSYRASDGTAFSQAATVTITVTYVAPPLTVTTISLAAATTAPAYAGTVQLTALLGGADGSMPANEAVVFERWNGADWEAIGTVSTDASGTAVQLSGALYAVQRYRARFAGSPTLAASMSSEVEVKPKAYLSTPNAPKTAKRSKSFTVKGYLKPRHAAKTYRVRIYGWKKNAFGSWVKYDYVSAKITNYKTYSKYSVKLKLTSKGSWRLRAYVVADGEHSAAWSSGYDYVTVK